MLKDKSAKNLQAGEILAAAGLVDPAASRFYYAMFQAAVHRLEQLGWSPARLEMGAVKWSHAMVAGNVSLVRRRREDRGLFRAMRQLREQADYEADSVEPERLASRAESLREFVEEAIR